MHSRIFQISTSPIHKDDYIEEDEYYDHWFLHSVADYVNGNTDRGNDIEWLQCCYKNNGLSFGKDDDGEYFIVADKIKYFESKFEAFKQALGALSTITIEDFVNDKCGMDVYRLKAAYDDKFGFYIDSDDTSLVTFDEFIRFADMDTRFYIGATIDYHF
jgi:hypothetical protein